MNVTLFDSDILIDASRGVNDAVNCLAKTQQNSSLAISVITQMELLVGSRNKLEQQAVEAFLKQFQIETINEEISLKAVELLRRYRLSHGLLIADSFIAATALVLDIPLISKNQRDYKYIVGLNLLTYP